MGGVLPLDDVDSGAIDLAGRFAEFVDRVHAAVGALSHPQSVRGWTEAIAAAADALTSTSERQSWQRRELQRLLDDVATESARDGGERDAALEPADVRALLADRLRGRPTRANFRTGHLTVCTLVPMRSVPHRVVCILGLDDGEYPRRARRDGDDLMLAEPHVGDRDPRAEDRQMLLDALLAATERLIITYTGNDERTNVRRPPAVPVGELLDIVERTVRCDSGSAREAVVIHHPLQPFDPAELHRGEAPRRRAVGIQRAGVGRGARTQRPPHAARPFPARGPSAPERSGGRAGSLGPVRRASDPGAPARPAGDERQRLFRRDTGRDAGRAGGARGVGRRAAAAGGRCGRRRATGVHAGRDRARRAPAWRAGPAAARPDRRDRRAGDRGGTGARRWNTRFARRQRRAPGRANAGRNRDRSVRGHGPCALLLAGQAARPTARLGAAAGAERGAPGVAVRVGGHRPGTLRRARRERDRVTNPPSRRHAGFPAPSGPRAARRAPRSLRPRDARAAAAGLRDLRRLRAGGGRRRGR